MKPSNLFFFLSLLSILIFGCNNDENNDSTFDVSGYLYTKGQPIANAGINLDDMVQYQAVSDNDGYFEIKNVSKGSHNLKTIKTYDDSTFITRSFELDVNDNLRLDLLILPNPVKLLSAGLDTAQNQVTLKWNKSTADDYREYKIYSHTSSGIDETTGTLEHVATNIEDTVVTLSIPNATTLYYRVFVLNEYGQLGGSNILSVTSENRNFFTGGDFEDESLFFSAWGIQGNVYIIDSVSYNNSMSLYLFSDFDTVNYYCTSYRFMPPQFLLNKNEEYKLSFWYKVRGIANMMDPFSFSYKQDNQDYLNINFGSIWEATFIPGAGPNAYIEESEWAYYSITFFPSSGTAVQFNFSGTVNELFIDDLELKRKLD
jgi:hypothetical protein